MEPDRYFRSDEQAIEELESAERALGATLFWWKQVLAAERASEWKGPQRIADRLAER
ncbi:hypothetical protein [Reyranella soli]|uniref:Uncharacterized protein n=1 Tax=Reyranella soli TaxID=1230389 RepID=A0A512NNE3_9HYPH|nr:hypothetical protein [Reyranella soli]GEP60448.1 hypothetical protein RSO01_76140 [Reyranella soli]